MFYITAGVTLVWFLAWMLLVTDMPEHDKFISDQVTILHKTNNILRTFQEKEFIIAHRTFDDTKHNEDDVPLIPLLL